jgi:adenine-specific DNA-methyltransferase
LGVNKVGLTISNKHIKEINEVVLSFPFKDCVLEGGQSKDDEKRKEIFFNDHPSTPLNTPAHYHHTVQK